MRTRKGVGHVRRAHILPMQGKKMLKQLQKTIQPLPETVKRLLHFLAALFIRLL